MARQIEPHVFIFDAAIKAQNEKWKKGIIVIKESALLNTRHLKEGATIKEFPNILTKKLKPNYMMHGDY